MERQIPKKDEIWEHFKGKAYFILNVGHHSETKERLVVYEPARTEKSSSDDSFAYMRTYSDDPCIRPLDMFMSEVDRKKYPDVKQKYRFERIF